MKKNKVTFKFGQHIAVLGGTGSGKTTWAKIFLNQIAAASNFQVPIYVIDSKIQGDFDAYGKKGYGNFYYGNNLPPVENKDGSPFVIFQPEYDDKELYNAFFQQIYQRRKPALVLIDELSSITGTIGTASAPRYYEILLKQGRGLGISVVTLSQTARYVPLSLLSQVMHVLMFNLNSEKDHKKLIDLLGDMAKITPQHQHGFFYRDVTKPIKSNPPFYYKDYKDFFLR